MIKTLVFPTKKSCSILGLIHGGRDELLPLSNEKIPPSRLTDAEWCGIDQSSEPHEHSFPESHSFFSLFPPFIKYVKCL